MTSRAMNQLRFRMLRRKAQLRMAAMRLLLLVVIAVGIAITCEAAHDVSHLSNRKLQDDDSICPGLPDPLMNPTHEVRYGVDTVWQVPRNPRGILFLAHADQRDVFSFFDRSPSCELCYGLPEDRSIALEALRRGYALISVKSMNASHDSESLDWSQDLENVINTINDIKREHSLDSRLPFAALGFSSGGFFIPILATKIPTRALLLMVSQGQMDVLENATPENFPPTFFVYMNATVDPDDPFFKRFPAAFTTRENVELSMAILSERGVSVGAKLCLPQPIRPHYFTERLPCASDEDSAKIQKAYKSAGWLDEADYLIEEPTWFDWDWLPPLPKSSRPSWYVPASSCSVDALCEELIRAWAFHCITSDANEEMFDWLDAKLSDDDDQLLLYDSR